MKTVKTTCDWCGCQFEKLDTAMFKRNFCCRAHLNQWNSNRVSVYNREENVMNKPEGQTFEQRTKQRERNQNRGEGKTYKKYYGRHEHRVVAEIKLGRPLMPGEIIHHIDGNKLNNSPDNLKIVTRSEHAYIHLHAWWAQKRGDVR